MADDKTKKAVQNATTTATTRPGAPPPPDAGVRQPDLTDGGQDTSVTGVDAMTSRSVPLYDGVAIARRVNPEQRLPSATYGIDPRPGTPALPISQGSTVGDERKKLYSMPPDELAALQDRLAQGGFYGKADAHGDFGYTKGQRDDSTVDAYNRWLVQSAREYKATGKTADDVLDDSIKSHSEANDLKSRTGTPGQQRTLTVDLTDVHQLSQMGDTVGQAILGRALTVAEKQALASYIHGRESARGQSIVGQQQADANANTASENAARDQGGLAQSTPDQIHAQEVENVDPQADTEDALREMHPGEAGANDMLEGLRQVAQLMRGNG